MLFNIVMLSCSAVPLYRTLLCRSSFRHQERVAPCYTASLSSIYFNIIRLEARHFVENLAGLDFCHIDAHCHAHTHFSMYFILPSCYKTLLWRSNLKLHLFKQTYRHTKRKKETYLYYLQFSIIREVYFFFCNVKQSYLIIWKPGLDK